MTRDAVQHIRNFDERLGAKAEKLASWPEIACHARQGGEPGADQGSLVGRLQVSFSKLSIPDNVSL